jgi:hypothetical protein
VCSGRQKPLAPTCNVCLIRDDLTTIWCEVTSSIRTREVIKAQDAWTIEESRLSAKKSFGTSKYSSDTSEEEESLPREQIKELYLCLRPIRDGRDKVEELYRFPPCSSKVVSEDSTTGPSSGNEGSSNDDKQSLEANKGQMPIKKRNKRSQSKEVSGDLRTKKTKTAI